MVRPLIGVVPGMELNEKHYKITKNNMLAIEQAGGIPLVVPYLTNSSMIDELIDRIDGLFLTGGDDIDPIYFNEEPHLNLGPFIPERDAFEMKITREILAKDKPVFGVCKGAQMLNLAADGDMYQDIHGQLKGELIQHRQKAANYVPIHAVELMKGSLIYRLAEEKTIRVNSYHHQANRKPGKHFIISGKARDGVVEVVESTVHRFALGVQWHPEHMKDPVSKKIFRGFVAACEEGKREKKKA